MSIWGIWGIWTCSKFHFVQSKLTISILSGNSSQTGRKPQTPRCEGSKNSIFLIFSLEELMRFCGQCGFLSEPNCLLDDVFTQQVFCTISAARRSIRLPGVSSTAVSCTFLRFAHLACRAGSLEFVQSAQIVCVFQCFKDHVMSVIFYMSTCLVCFSRLSHLCVARHGLPPFSGPMARPVTRWCC